MIAPIAPPVVRVASKDDLPAIVDLIRQPDFKSGELTPEIASGIWERLERYPDYRTLIAEDARGVVGTLALIVVDHLGFPSQRVALVENVMVHAEARQQGVGRALMAEAGRLATESGAYKLILATGMQREGAHAFYENLGFERYGYSYGLPLRDVA